MNNCTNMSGLLTICSFCLTTYIYYSLFTRGNFPKLAYFNFSRGKFFTIPQQHLLNVISIHLEGKISQIANDSHKTRNKVVMHLLMLNRTSMEGGDFTSPIMELNL